MAAAWSAHSRHTARVRGALLVAPPDTEREDMPPNLFNWRPIVRERLPFASLVVASTDDPYCALPRAERMAADWGASVVLAGPRGHLNSASVLVGGKFAATPFRYVLIDRTSDVCNPSKPATLQHATC